MKKPISFIAVLAMVLSVCLPLTAGAVVEPSEAFYVADYANVLSESTEQIIIDTNGYLEQNCDGAQIVVVTIEYLDTFQYSDEYAVYLFNQWGVGNADTKNGMLLLLVTKEGKGWLTTGAGISSEFDSNTADSYLNDYFWDEFDRGNYDTAVMQLFPQLVYWFEAKYGTEGGYDEHYGGEIPDPPMPVPDNHRSGIDISFFIRNAWIIILVLILIINIMSDRRRYRAYYRYMGLPIPRYHFWYLWMGGPYRYYNPYTSTMHHTTHHHDDDDDHHHSSGGGFFGGGGFGGGSSGGFGGGGGFGGFGGGSGFGGGGFSGGGGGGRR